MPRRRGVEMVRRIDVQDRLDANLLPAIGGADALHVDPASLAKVTPGMRFLSGLLLCPSVCPAGPLELALA